MRQAFIQGAAALSLAAGGLLSLAAPAVAQTSNSGVGLGASKTLNQPAPAPTPTPFDSFSNPEHLFGDWGSVRTDLGRLGINILFDYTSETAGNVSGGTRRALDYADQRALEVDIDWQKLAGITGFSTHMVAVNRAGNNTSAAAAPGSVS